jgi:hypothetical protein
MVPRVVVIVVTLGSVTVVEMTTRDRPITLVVVVGVMVMVVVE